MRIHQLIDEIKHHQESTRRSAQEIHRILENNKKLFDTYLDENTTNTFINFFADLADASVLDYQTENYQRQFEQSFNSLNYQLDRII